MARRRNAGGARLAAAAKRTLANASAPVERPASVELARPFSFHGDAGTFHTWQEGAVVTDPVQIAMLIERRAPLKEAPCLRVAQ